MVEKGSPRGKTPNSHDPETEGIDASWDEEALSPASAPNVFDRPTAIPSLPTDEYVTRMMAEADAREAEEARESGTQKSAPQSGRRATPSPKKPPIPRREPPAPARTTANRAITERTPLAPRRELAAARLPVPSPNTPSEPMRVSRMDTPPATAVTPKTRLADPDDLSFERSVRKSFASVADTEIEVSGETSLDAALADLDMDLDTELAAAAPTSAFREMKDRYATGDFTGSLAAAEEIIARDPADPEARRYAESCRQILMQMYSARLGALNQVPSVTLPTDQIRWLSLDHRAGFMLSLIDGTSSLEEILDICGMPRLDALRIMHALLEQRVISLRPRNG